MLVSTPLIQEHIRKGEVHLIKDLMHRSSELGMQTFDQSLITAYKAGLISGDVAIRHADSANDVRLNIKLHAHGQGVFSDASNLNLEIAEDQFDER